jgi:hypothetical protein
MPLLKHAVGAPLRVHRETIQLSRKPDGEISDIDRFLNFPLSLRNYFAHLGRD